MPRSKKAPSYRRHKRSGQAIVSLPNSLGKRRDVLLGTYGSKQSRQEYARVIAEWEAGATPIGTHGDLTVNELLVNYLEHGLAVGPSETRNIKGAIRWLKELYGHTLAGQFSSLGLEAIRGKMIAAGLCRNRINKDMSRLRRVFKWAGAKRLVPAAIFHELALVEGLREGRSAARETDKIGPVAIAVVEATLPLLPPIIADMVQLQMLTGMRSGELVAMRGLDLETSGKIWHYRPPKHKTAHHGHQRTIALGPKAQAIVKRYLQTDLQAPLFSPRESMRLFRERQRRERKSKVQPSQANRAKERPRKQPGACYTPGAYGQRIRLAIIRANETARKENPGRPVLIPHWHPHQLRHLRATDLRKRYGIDAARVVLGHRSPKITETYAELDVGKADAIMAELG